MKVSLTISSLTHCVLVANSNETFISAGSSYGCPFPHVFLDHRYNGGHRSRCTSRPRGHCTSGCRLPNHHEILLGVKSRAEAVGFGFQVCINAPIADMQGIDLQLIFPLTGLRYSLGLGKP